LPDGSIYGPVLGPVNLDLSGGQVVSRERYQIVPASAPFGVYSYNAYAGVYPDTVWDSDAFNFEKEESAESSAFSLPSGWLRANEGFQERRIEFKVESPSEFGHVKVYPNPFNPSTLISFELPAASQVKLDVFDVRGNIVGATHASPMRSAWYPPGSHQIMFNGSGLASGIYIYQLGTENFTSTGKMVLMK
jgi:hypothetical protein